MRVPWICLLSCALLASSLRCEERFWDEIPPSPSTTPPTVVLDDYWNSEFTRVNREVSTARDCQLVFFGDSITLGWSEGKAPGREIWKEKFGGYQPINMGNSGDITPVMLYRVTHGNLEFPAGCQPRVAVLLCGINNFGVTRSAGGRETWDLGSECPPEDIAAAQRAIAQVFRRRLPKTRVIMMALLPVADGVKWEKCQRVNAVNARIAYDSNEVAYLNVQDRLLHPDGNLKRAMFTDGLHLSEEGYRAWAEGLDPLLGAFMRAPPLAPVNIMLIGGSITEGSESSTSYRRYLDGLLRRNGHQIDFVGGRRKHNDDRTDPDSFEYDVEHEGHWGRDSAWFAENMAGLLKAAVPDVAVIELGAAEMDAVPTGGEADMDRITANIQRVMQALRSANKDVKIVITSVVSSGKNEEHSRLLNNKLLALARTTSSPRQPVVFSAIAADIDIKQDWAGNVPTSSGARKIAARLADTLHAILSNPGRK